MIDEKKTKAYRFLRNLDCQNPLSAKEAISCIKFASEDALEDLTSDASLNPEVLKFMKWVKSNYGNKFFEAYLHFYEHTSRDFWFNAVDEARNYIQGPSKLRSLKGLQLEHALS